MASVGSVTRQIAALEISAKQNGATKPSRPIQKPAGQASVSKLLTKFAAPHPFPEQKPKSTVRTGPPRSAAPAGSSQPATTRPPASASQKAPPPASKPSLSKPTSSRELDIGKYDGGFEIENEKRGEKIEGEAAQELALDSSVSGLVWSLSPSSFASIPTRLP
jgi:aurora kinase